MKINYKFEGGKELEAALKKLPDQYARKAGEAAVRAGSNLLRKEIEAKAPVGDEPDKKVRLKDSFRVRRNKKNRTGVSYVIHTFAPHAHLIEFGTTGHTINAGTHRGQPTGKKVLSNGNATFGTQIQHPGFPAAPFIRPAIDENTEKILKRMIEVLARAINRQATKFVDE